MDDGSVKMKWQDNIVVMAGNWEPLAHRRRALCGAVDDEKLYEREHSSEMINRLLDANVTSVVWHFFKGFGLKFENEEMLKAAEFSQLCHKNSIKFGTYINFGSIYPSTFLLEEPKAKKWLAIDSLGQPHSYSEFFRCYYRLRLCMGNLDYREYIKQVSLKAIELCQSDWIHFDNNAQMACYCKKCKRDFREYLEDKYTENAEIRFGHKYLKKIELPKGSPRMGIDTLTSLHEPVLQEWVDFRCAMLADSINEVSHAIKEKYPDIVIGINPSFDAGEFGPLLWGCDVEKLSGKVDVIWSEDTNFPGIIESSSAIVGHLFTFKYGSSLHAKIAVHQTGATHKPENVKSCELSLFESAVFNQGFLGHIYHAPDLINGRDILPEHCKTIDFITANKEYFCPTNPVYEIALLRSNHSHKNRWSQALRSRLLMEQVLSQYCFQFDIISQANLSDLKRYNVLLLPNAICLSNDDISYIKKYVHQGGMLVATEDSAMCDDWARARESAGLMKYFGESQQDITSQIRLDVRKELLCKVLGIDPVDAERVFYIPELSGTKTYLHTFRDMDIPMIDNKYWELPMNAYEIANTIKRALGKRQLISIPSASYIVAQLVRVKNDKQIILHLLNYNVSNPVKNLTVKVSLEIMDDVKSVKTISNGQNSVADIPVRKTQEYIEFEVDHLNVYKGIIFEH